MRVPAGTLVPMLLLVLGPAAAKAGTTHFPGAGEFGTLLFEDNWPHEGDLDFNDATLRYNARVDTQDPTGEATALELTLPLAALGTADTCGGGLGLHLLVAASTPMTVTTSAAGASPVVQPPDPIEPEAVFWLADDLRAELCAGETGFLNTDDSLPPVACDTLVVEVVFQPPLALDTSDPPFDLFLHRCGDRSHQVHRPAYGGTA